MRIDVEADSELSKLGSVAKESLISKSLGYEAPGCQARAVDERRSGSPASPIGHTEWRYNNSFRGSVFTVSMPALGSFCPLNSAAVEMQPHIKPRHLTAPHTFSCRFGSRDAR